MAADFASLHSGELAWRWSAGLLTVGCCSAVLAMPTGLLELSKVPEGRPLADCYRHMGLMMLAFALFGLRLLVGLDQMQPVAPNKMALALDVGGFASLVVGGWYGGKLVYGHGIGQAEDRHR
nr:DUF2231 domain-containing protein [Alcanivorax sp. 24]